MSKPKKTAREIFLAAVEVHPDERVAPLDLEYVEDTALRKHLEEIRKFDCA